jgi:hypothetical protein
VRKIVVTFGGKAYDALTRRTVECAPKLGADDVMVFDDRWLMDTGFVARNEWLFEARPAWRGEGWIEDVKFGFGHCAWKSFVIQSAFDRVDEGDVVLYLDADTFPIAWFGQLFPACAEAGGLLLFEEKGCKNLKYTKSDAMLAMGLSVEDSNHACARINLWQKGPLLPRQMLNEWWAYSVNPRCMLWDKSVLTADHPRFLRHCDEQSVLSNLARKYGVPLHRTPDQNGAPQSADDPDVDFYPQVFEQRWADGDRSDLSGSAYRTC